MSAISVQQTSPDFPSQPRPLALAIALALSTPLAHSATITVDAHSTPGCTLSDAVTAANTNTATNDCVAGSGADLIVFDSSLSGSTITPADELPISSRMTIDGDSVITVSGGNSHRVFHASSTLNSTLQGLTIRDGYAYYGGGGMYNSGALTIQNCTVMNNRTYLGVGGGISNNGGTMTVRNSTVSDNSAEYENGMGGGIANAWGNLTIENSTISGNTTAGFGGGVANATYSILVVRNSTISNNSAKLDGGDGLFANGFPESISNTVIANSSIGGDCGGYTSLLVNTGNWFKDNSCDGVPSGDPNLGALADNGGPTLTHLPSLGSGLIDAGDAVECTATDQRDISRPQDGDENGTAICDIGAVEVVYSTTDTCQTGPVTIYPHMLSGTIQTHQSETSLGTAGEVIVLGGADIAFEASDGISLNGGFQVVAGGIFSANTVAVTCLML